MPFASTKTMRRDCPGRLIVNEFASENVKEGKPCPQDQLKY